MQPLHEQARVVVGHLVDTRFFTVIVYSRETRRFALTHLAFRRPAAGADVAEAHCGECGRELLVRVRSVADTKRVRGRYLAVALAGAAVAAGAVVFGSLVYLPLADPLGKLVLIAFLAGLPVAGVAGWLWWREDGVRLMSATGDRDREHWRMDAPLPYAARP
ncbi:hypothetical protein SAMN05216298_1511 [Glycomyces sambucus]|uniref:Uncharacterized protein n=1 Tax=Glycomyces sambucus TaxID=380244 RepID=A0A1G9F1G5_9ACTN|nr:hypothetical protein [Glycomyces sambucus]SDK82115.1 hypothetical protein SAMN05216298_1511 [Glycomyces sambucus]